MRKTLLFFGFDDPLVSDKTDWVTLFESNEIICKILRKATQPIIGSASNFLCIFIFGDFFFVFIQYDELVSLVWA